jgi:hypothetical protein
MRVRGSGSGRRQVLRAHALRRVAFEVGLEHRRSAGLALRVGAVAETLERPVDTVEDGGRPGQFGLIERLHERAG